MEERVAIAQMAFQRKINLFLICATTIVLNGLLSGKINEPRVSGRIFTGSICLVNIAARFGVIEIFGQAFLWIAFVLNNETLAAIQAYYTESLESFNRVVDQNQSIVEVFLRNTKEVLSKMQLNFEVDTLMEKEKLPSIEL